MTLVCSLDAPLNVGVTIASFTWSGKIPKLKLSLNRLHNSEMTGMRISRKSAGIQYISHDILESKVLIKNW